MLTRSFITSVVSKNVELKTGLATKNLPTNVKKITSGIILNQITTKEIVLKA